MDTPDSQTNRKRISLKGWQQNTLMGDLHPAVGTAHQRTVILLHGGGQTRHSWRSTAQHLADRGWNAISIDQRGHGDSAWSEGGNYHFDDFAKDLTAVAKDTENKFGTKPVVIGASLGGISAMIAEGEAPASVLSAVVLVDVTPRMRQDGVDKILGFMRERAVEGFATLEEAADAISAYLPNRPRPKDLSGLEKNLRRGSDNRFRWHWDPKFVVETNGRTSPSDRDVMYRRLEKAVRNIKVPLLLVRGKASELVDEETAAEFMQLAPHAEFADVSEAGHMVAGDKNDVFTDAVIVFLEKY
ncbi:MAG: alpha/beta fold hydrolase [Hyphomicrobiales bacterium]